MTPENYADFVDTDGKKLSARDVQTLGGMGIAGEAGEVCDLLKKVVFHGKEMNRDDLLKELGDVQWYAQLIMNLYGITDGEVKTRNVVKLCARYPERYGAPENWLTKTP